MKQTLHIELDVELFQLEEIEIAEALAKKEGGAIYTSTAIALDVPIGIASWRKGIT